MTKSILTSKTFWANLIVGILTILGLFNPELLTILGIDNPLKFMAIIVGLVMPVLNIILRFITNKGVALPGKSTNV
jgi:hypothetical protein